MTHDKKMYFTHYKFQFCVQLPLLGSPNCLPFLFFFLLTLMFILCKLAKITFLSEKTTVWARIICMRNHIFEIFAFKDLIHFFFLSSEQYTDDVLLLKDGTWYILSVSIVFIKKAFLCWLITVVWHYYE